MRISRSVTSEGSDVAEALDKLAQAQRKLTFICNALAADGLDVTGDARDGLSLLLCDLADDLEQVEWSLVHVHAEVGDLSEGEQA